MNKRALLLVGLFFAAPLHAAFSPGVYEIQDLTGHAIGSLTVSLSSTTVDEKPGTKITWFFDYSSRRLLLTEKHDAYSTQAGFVSFRQEVKDAKGTFVTQGRIDGPNMIIWANDHGRKFSSAVPVKDIEISEYALETSTSPFWKLKLKEAKSAKVFRASELNAVITRRNVNEITTMTFNGKDTRVFVVSTNFDGTVVTSWITEEGHIVLKERWKDRVFVRTGS